MDSRGNIQSSLQSRCRRLCTRELDMGIHIELVHILHSIIRHGDVQCLRRRDSMELPGVGHQTRWWPQTPGEPGLDVGNMLRKLPD